MFYVHFNEFAIFNAHNDIFQRFFWSKICLQRLKIVFILLTIAGVVAYKYHSNCRNFSETITFNAQTEKKMPKNYLI